MMHYRMALQFAEPYKLLGEWSHSEVAVSVGSGSGRAFHLRGPRRQVAVHYSPYTPFTIGCSLLDVDGQD